MMNTEKDTKKQARFVSLGMFLATLILSSVLSYCCYSYLGKWGVITFEACMLTVGVIAAVIIYKSIANSKIEQTPQLELIEYQCPCGKLFFVDCNTDSHPEQCPFCKSPGISALFPITKDENTMSDQAEYVAVKLHMNNGEILSVTPAVARGLEDRLHSFFKRSRPAAFYLGDKYCFLIPKNISYIEWKA